MKVKRSSKNSFLLGSLSSSYSWKRKQVLIRAQVKLHSPVGCPVPDQQGWPKCPWARTWRCSQWIQIMVYLSCAGLTVQRNVVRERTQPLIVVAKAKQNLSTKMTEFKWIFSVKFTQGDKWHGSIQHKCANVSVNGEMRKTVKCFEYC